MVRVKSTVGMKFTKFTGCSITAMFTHIKMKKLILLALLLVPVSAFAQTPPAPTSYRAVIAGAASSNYDFPVAAVQCGATALPGTPTTVNPRLLVWDHTVANQFCVHDTGNATGPLFALPIGDYTITLFAIASTGSASISSEPSNTVPFSRLVPPAARTGLRVRGAQ